MSQVWQWIMGAIAQLVGALKAAAAGIFGKVLATFGLTMVTFSSVLPPLKAYIINLAGSLPAQYIDFLGAIGIGKAMSMILSALTIRLAWKVFIVPKAAIESLGT